MAVMSERFTQAVDYARIAHAQQTRKGGKIPYLYHLLGVASIAMQYGGDEDQCIAALLHDTVEDCGQEHAALIRAQFGDRVADLVLACTVGTAESKAASGSKASWLSRKQQYLEHLRHEPLDARFVSACDKLHNAHAIVSDMEELAAAGSRPVELLDRFNAPPAQTIGYYVALQDRLAPLPEGLAGALRRAVLRMQEYCKGVAVHDFGAN